MCDWGGVSTPTSSTSTLVSWGTACAWDGGVGKHAWDVRMDGVCVGALLCEGRRAIQRVLGAAGHMLECGRQVWEAGAGGGMQP